MGLCAASCEDGLDRLLLLRLALAPGQAGRNMKPPFLLSDTAGTETFDHISAFFCGIPGMIGLVEDASMHLYQAVECPPNSVARTYCYRRKVILVRVGLYGTSRSGAPLQTLILCISCDEGFLLVAEGGGCRDLKSFMSTASERWSEPGCSAPRLQRTDSINLVVLPTLFSFSSPSGC